MAFLICGWTSIVHIFHVRSIKSVFKTPIKNNKTLAISAAAIIVVFGIMAASPVRGIFGFTLIGGYHWLTVICLSVIPTMCREAARLVDNIPYFAERRQVKKAALRKKI
jgi:magnesium-transporting ATPase (P-type)